MTTERAGILLKYGVLQCSKKEHRFLFLLNYFIPGIPKEPAFFSKIQHRQRLRPKIFDSKLLN